MNKIKYYLNGFTILGIILIVISIILFFVQFAGAETVIYDNLTTSQYKSIQIDDITNVKYLDEYNYKVYIDGNYLGEYKKGDIISVPDGSEVLIFIPSNIKQSINADNLASMVGVGFYAFMQYGIYIIIILLVFFWRRKK